MTARLSLLTFCGHISYFDGERFRPHMKYSRLLRSVAFSSNGFSLPAPSPLRGVAGMDPSCSPSSVQGFFLGFISHLNVITQSARRLFVSPSLLLLPKSAASIYLYCPPTVTVVLSLSVRNRGCKFESCTCHNKDTIGEEGNGKPPH